LKGIMIGLAVSYPLLAHLAVVRGSEPLLALSLAVLALAVVLPGLARGSVAAIAGAAVIAVLLAGLARSSLAWLPLYAPSVITDLIAAALFARTLSPGHVPLIERFDNLTMKDGLPSHKVHCVLPASDGKLWVGTYRGVLVREDGKFRRISTEDGLTSEIDILSKEVRRLDRVVKTFLDFSRPVDVRLVEVDLSALVREVADLMTPQARLARIDLEFEALPGESLRIRGDADMLKQAVLNLVTNGLDAMTDGGTLRMSVSRNGDSVILEVADNGPGIPPELRQKVFQLYFTTKPAGSGIGLAMTYRAVQLHNGTIGFVSENGRGTIFRLEFPAFVHA